jgi:hypothetical protein
MLHIHLSSSRMPRDSVSSLLSWIIPTFISRDWGKPRKTTIWIARAPSEIWTKNLNTSLQHYH